MRIAHISLYPPKGEKHVSGSGVVSYTKNLVTNITAQKPVEQYMLCNKINRAYEVYQEDGLHIHRCFDRGNQFVWQLHKELKKIRPDVIHIQQELSLFGGISTAYLLRHLVYAWRDKVVVTFHGIVDPAHVNRDFVRQNNSTVPTQLVRLAFRIIYTPLAKWARHIIVHEEKFKNTLVRSYGIPADKISVIPHGIENLDPMPASVAREKLSIPADAHVVLFMGYATGYKGIDLLLDGFGEYAQKDPKAFLIIGAGKHPKLSSDSKYLAEYRRLEEKAAKLLDTNQHRWVGFIDEHEIQTYYSASDVSVYPYTIAMASSGPMSFAIGYEKPFLASDAFQDIFHDTPELIFARSSQSLAERLDDFFTHHDQHISISSKLKAIRSWSNVGNQTALAYETVTTNTKG